MKPFFEKDLEKKGFKILLWSVVGWVRFFSKQPIISPADLKKQKIFVWEGDANEVQVWKESGFQPVPLAATDIMSSLQSGMIEVIPAPPLAAASNQWFGIAKHMCSLKWGPLIGGVVISTKTWNKIPADLRPQLEKVAQQIGTEMQQEVFAAEDQAIEIMLKHGLIIHQVSPEIEKQWQAIVNQGLTRFAGKNFDQKSYEMVKQFLFEFRAKK